MLSTPDARLVERDPDIRALALLLDATDFAGVLRRLYPDAGITAVTSHYIRYKPGTSCLVGYRVSAADGPVHVYARAHSPATREKLRKAGQRGSVSSQLGCGVKVLEEHDVAVFPFPNDHELESLRALADAPGREALLRELLPGHPTLWSGRVDVLRYKPERRCVVRVQAPGHPGATLRFYTRDDSEGLRTPLKPFRTVDPLRVPDQLGRSGKRGVTAFEWLEGTVLEDVLGTGQAAPGAFELVGTAVAALHGQKARKHHRGYDVDRHARSLLDTAEVLGEVVPEVAGRARAVAGRIARHLLDHHWRQRAIHGDLSADQVLLQEGRVALLDFDRAGRGDPRMDLGNFQARLEYDAARGVLAADRAGTVFRELLDAYRRGSGKDVTGRLEWFTAAGLLLCAIEPFRRREESWPDRVATLVGRAEAFAGGGGHA